MLIIKSIKNVRFHVLTLGCKINLYESEAISYSLKSNGYILEEDIKKCDIIILNTCT
ncbi:MAG: tRNA (N(6)-L-threonylcarbamoyladenosine(37)-C(2))-methylthiotransferase MtaB, partial [Spirochaetes bacterium]|nr:tRNA (N(6)-L-threonylcarbamoyladenosine(37)-C(2))-methylthiotransferase MtaB [Spirochaetota bacterium]